MNNREITEAIRGMADAIAVDKHGGTRDFVLRRLLDVGIIDSMPVSALDPHRPLPADWTALQLAVFDNGEQPEPKRKRDMIQRTKTRYGGNLKVWTDRQINFRNEKQVAWRRNLYFWDHTTANRVAEELRAQKFIDDESCGLMQEVVERGGEEWLYAIPLLKEFGSGTRWTRNHVVMLRLGQNGFPNGAALIHPAGQEVVTEFSDQTSNGGQLGGNTLAQARLSRTRHAADWATESLDS